MRPCALTDLVRLMARPQWRRGHDLTEQVRPGKVVAGNLGEITVLLLGIRINKWHQPRHWLPLLLAMPAALRELRAQPEGGLLSYRLLIGPGPRQAVIMQYWRGSADIHAFVHGRESTHRAAQRRLWQHYADADGAVGVWHEMFPLADRAYHGMYGNMPPTGIGTIRPLVPSTWNVDPAGSQSQPRRRR